MPENPNINPPGVLERRVAELERLKAQNGNVGFLDALKLVRLEDFQEIRRIPCFAPAVDFGLYGGVLIGSLRFLSVFQTRPLLKCISTASHFYFGGFIASALIAREICIYSRGKQKIKVFKRPDPHRSAADSSQEGIQKI